MIVNLVVENGVLMFILNSCRYLLFIKNDQIQHVLYLLNSFDKNLPFTVDIFNNGNIHFVDIKILNNGENDSYIKDNSTSLLVQYNSY